MLLGKPKTTFLISPQRWDALQVSKHHYARELGSLGHSVFFIEPPRPGPPFEMAPTDAENVTRVSYRTWFPYALKFRSRRLFDLAMKRQARRLVASIGRRPDIVWDFDNSFQFADLSAFGAHCAVFHLVDQPATGRRGMKSADLVLSVGQHYLDAIAADPRRAFVVPHGLGAHHAAHAHRLLELSDDALSQRHAARPAARPRAAFVGNLETPAFDGETILAQAIANPGVDVELIGPFSAARANDVGDILGRLSRPGNVTMTGRLEAAQILARAQDVDIWLISYDRSKTPDGSVNPHKVLEYFATGRSVLSSRLDTHADRPELIHMPPTHDNATLPAMLADLAGRVDEINAPDLQRRRARYALQFSYAQNVRLIDGYIEDLQL